MADIKKTILMDNDVSQMSTVKESKIGELSADTLRAKKRDAQKVLYVIIVVLVVAVAALAAGYIKAQREMTQLRASGFDEGVNRQEIEQVLTQVGRLIILPQGEEPVMATVVDAEALAKEQPFYANAINGDKVLVYLQNKQAIIYSPERDIIVNVGPVVINDENLSTDKIENSELAEVPLEVPLIEEPIVDSPTPAATEEQGEPTVEEPDAEAPPSLESLE